MGKRCRSRGGGYVADDPDYRGPFEKRSCTDVICAILFFIFFLGFLAVGVWAYVQGDPRILLYPTDSQGNLCGYQQFSGKPHLFFFDFLDCASAGVSVVFSGCPTPQVCVEKCPDTNWVFLEAVVDHTKKKNLICKYDINPETTSTTVETLVRNEDCAAYYVKSTPVAGRCIPSEIMNLLNSAGNIITSNNSIIVDKFNQTVNGTVLEQSTKYLSILMNVKDVGNKVLQDVRGSWWLMAIGLVFAMIWCFFWILLLRCLAGIIVWITIALFIVFFAAATAFCFYKYHYLQKVYPNQSGTVYFTTNLNYYTNLKDTWLALGIIAAVVLVISSLVLLFLRKRIMIAVALIKEASRAIGHMLFVLVWPLIPWLLLFAFIAYWGASAVYLAATGKRNFSSMNVTYENTSDVVKKEISKILTDVPCEPGNSTAGEICNFLKYGGGQFIYALQAYQLFMIFWISNFVIALSHMTLAGAFGSYYWAWNKPGDIPVFPVTMAVWRALRYHIGTMAFGALIIAIVQMIRVILEYIDRKLKGKENALAKFLVKCLKCCFWCLEKVLKFITKNAYIMTAIRGLNFCRAACKAFGLILANIVRVAVVDKVTDFVLFISKLVVVGGVVSLAWFFFSGEAYKRIPIQSISDYIKAYTPDLNYYLLPVIILGLASFVIATAFFSVYEMGVDTLFLCFLEDIEMNENASEKRYYMSKELMKIIGVKNEAPQVTNGGR